MKRDSFQQCFALSIMTILPIWIYNIGVVITWLSARKLDLQQEKHRNSDIDQIRAACGRDLEYQPVVPRCAKGLIFPLVQPSSLLKNVSSETAKWCKGDSATCGCFGFLLRDDTILTSIECAQQTVAAANNTGVAVSSYTVELSIESKERLNANQNHPELAVVNLRVAKYGGAGGWPRIRMFLNRSSGRDNRSTYHGCSIFHLNDIIFNVHCMRRKVPILSVFASNDVSVIPGTIGNDSMIKTDMNQFLWNDTDQIESVAKMSNTKGQTWWVKKQSKAVFEKWIAELSNDYRGPNGTLSVIDAQGVGAVLQAEDPTGRGRSMRCMEYYYKYWRHETPFSGEAFFDWLDFGSGKKIHLTKCSRNELRYGTIRFFNETERKNAAVDIEVKHNGSVVMLRFAMSKKRVPSGDFEYVWGTDRTLYVKRKGPSISHVTFFRAKPVLMAGEMTVTNGGRLVSINKSSGHYKPSDRHLHNFYQFFKSLGVS